VPLTGPPDTSYPASSPYVIAVGGTNLFTNADFTYDYEIAWEASGGGPSYFENPPFWQSYTGSGALPVVPTSVGSAAALAGAYRTFRCAPEELDLRFARRMSL